MYPNYIKYELQVISSSNYPQYSVYSVAYVIIRRKWELVLDSDIYFVVCYPQEVTVTMSLSCYAT